MSNKSMFEGIERLYGAPALKTLAASKVMIVGLGGVGSWSAEALARSGVGNFILVDLDDICVTNINRQLHALPSTVGALKTDETRKRILAINPSAEVQCVEDFFSQSSCEDILSLPCDYVVDAIDGVKSKSLLISACRQRNIPLVVTGGAGGKSDPALIQEADLNRSYNCSLLTQVRKKLKREHGFPRDKRKKFKIPCVFSPEEQHMPPQSCSSAQARRLNCQNGFGSSVFVTGSFGFAAAARVVNDLIKNNKPQERKHD